LGQITAHGNLDENKGFFPMSYELNCYELFFPISYELNCYELFF